MKEIELLHKNLSNACPEIHNIRLNVLMATVTSTITGQQLTVTGPGRNLKAYSKIHTRHDIKREVMKLATDQPRSLGSVLFSKQIRFSCEGVLKRKERTKRKNAGGTHKDGKSLYFSFPRSRVGMHTGVKQWGEETTK